MAEPTKNKRISLGIVVLLYLGVLFVLVYALKRIVLEGRSLDAPSDHAARGTGGARAPLLCNGAERAADNEKRVLARKEIPR